MDKMSISHLPRKRYCYYFCYYHRIITIVIIIITKMMYHWKVKHIKNWATQQTQNLTVQLGWFFCDVLLFEYDCNSAAGLLVVLYGL